MLFEIGIWHGVQHFEDEFKGKTAEGQREKLKELARGRLGPYVGKVWMEAVVFCLELEDKGDVEEEFFRRVIRPLSSCKV